MVPSRDQIAEVREHINATGRILSELEHELNARIGILEQLQTDAKRYEQLASLNVEQAGAIENMVAHQFEAQSRVTWWQWWVAIVVAVVSGFVINWVSGPLSHLLFH
jgi:hypothetical protein